MTKADIMKAEEMCSILGIKSNTLYSKRWRIDSGIPVFRQGRYIFAYRIKFDEWYQKRAIWK